MMYLVLAPAWLIYKIMEDAILSARETSFEGVNFWGGRNISFKNVWVRNCFGERSKKDISISLDPNRAFITYDVDRRRAETLLSVHSTFSSKLGVRSSAKAIMIHVANEEEKKAWEDFVAKARSKYFENRLAERTPNPQKVTPKAA